MTESKYPYEFLNVIILGPEVFVSKDGSVINYKGQNYVRQAEPPRHETREWGYGLLDSRDDSYA